VPPDATVVVVDVIAAVVTIGLDAGGSPPAAEVVAVTAGRFANSPVPVLSAVQKQHRHTTIAILLVTACNHNADWL